MSYWHNHRALVLGGAGFCGSHLVSRLVEEDAQVLAVDKWLPRDSFLCQDNLLDQIHFEQLDLLDLAGLRLLLGRYPVETVFLLAAQPLAPLSNQLPLETAQTNIIGTYNVLEAVRLCAKPPRLVFASSGAYYGSIEAEQAITEDAPALAAGNIYAATKASADLAVRCYSRIYGLRAACCRWMNTYGPGDTNFSRIIPSTFARLVAGGPPRIDGTDGQNVLEMLHVRDMVQAYLSVAERLDCGEVSGEAFNFGSGQPMTLLSIVQEAAKAFASVSGSTERTVTITGPSVKSCKFLDITKAQSLLGWQPSVTLADGLKECAHWYSEYLQTHTAMM